MTELNINKEHNVNNKRKTYNSSYYNKHKDSLKEKIKCPDCGFFYMKYNKSNHLKTKKHTTAVIISKYEKDLAQIRTIIKT